jgi:D-alanyl-D-alanine carboxypeptidase
MRGTVSWALLYVTSTMAVSATSHPAITQTLDPGVAKRVDAAVLGVLKEDRAPSASIAIVREGHLVYAAAYGYARLSPMIPATLQTRYQLASISKTLTAEVLLSLEEDSKINLDDPVSLWLPDLSGNDRPTVRELLQHTSGYPDHYPQTYPAGPRARPTTPDQIIGEWGRHSLLFEPGTRFRYSNLNYVIAGRIAEKAAGESLFAILQKKVFEPLGMNSARDLDSIGPQTPDVAMGYVRHALGTLRPAPHEGQGWSFGARDGTFARRALASTHVGCGPIHQGSVMRFPSILAGVGRLIAGLPVASYERTVSVPV